jgi:flagellar motor switch protein FliG
MLAPLLHPLDREQSSLLLATLTFGGQDAMALLDLLPDEVSQPLKKKSEKLLEIPKEKRIPLMLRELKQYMQFRHTRGIDGVDPSWLAAGFKGESPRVIAAALMHMPASLSRQVIERLPAELKALLPSRAELQKVPLPIIKLVRARYDEKFASMPVLENDVRTLSFKEIMALEGRELVAVTRAVGIDELACAFAAVGKRALAELLTRLPRHNADELIAGVRRVDAQDVEDSKTAQRFLSRVLDGFTHTEELFQKAGLYRLAKACVYEDNELVRRICQRFPRAHGKLLLDYLQKARDARDSLTEERAWRTQDAILDQVKELAGRGKIASRYLAAEFRFRTRG